MNENKLNMKDIFNLNNNLNLKNNKFKRITNNLKWRQQFANSLNYKYTLNTPPAAAPPPTPPSNTTPPANSNNKGKELYFNQISNGELNGIGTGAVVWPAANILSKYIEKKYNENGLKNKRIIDIGSGTGFVGIICAALGGNVTLTDQLCVQDLIISNIEKYHQSIENDHELLSEGSVIFQEYNWEETADHLSPPFDLVIVSDCVLPKLYPIEPLIKVIYFLQ